jgi:hypothetical protein
VGDEDPGGNVEPYLNSESEGYYRYRSDLSLAPQKFLPPANFVVTRVILHSLQHAGLSRRTLINAAGPKENRPNAGKFG